MDTAYNQQILERLSSAFADERAHKAGQLSLSAGDVEIVCDMIFDDAWRGSPENRYF